MSSSKLITTSNMITIYDILTELQSFLHVDKKDLDFAKKSKINDSNNNEFKSLVNKWSTGVYDEDPDQLLNSLLDLLEKSESVGIIESLIDKQISLSETSVDDFKDIGDLSKVDTKINDHGNLVLQIKNQSGNMKRHFTIYKSPDKTKYGINITGGTIESPSQAPNATWWNLGNKYYDAAGVRDQLKQYGVIL